MAIETIPVWPFEPNWSNNVTETLEWLTTILTSPTGAEQRRCNRLFPRREIEFTIAVADGERTAADTHIMLHGGRTMYLPLWHESYRLATPAVASAIALSVEDADNGGFAAGDILFVGSVTGPFDYELVEVAGVSGEVVTLAGSTSKPWPQHSRVHPVRKARLTDQPAFSGASDSLSTASCVFATMEVNDEHDLSVAAESFETYDGFNVLTTEPDWSSKATRSFERMIDTYDNQVSSPIFRDTAGISFPTQSFHWINRGRAEYERFRKTVYALAGRFRPVWLPTFAADLQMVASTAAGASNLTIGMIGYTASGGIVTGRDRICIMKKDGTRHYRRIIGSSVTGDGHEVVVLDSPFAAGLERDSVLRISFMQLSRLNQDRLEIVHKTDTQGVSLCSATFRAAPNIREVRAGF